MQVSDIYLSLVDIYIFLGAWISTTFNIEVHLAWILIMMYKRSRHSGLTEIWSWALLFTFERFGIENVCILLNTILWAVEHSVELAIIYNEFKTSKEANCIFYGGTYTFTNSPSMFHSGAAQDAYRYIYHICLQQYLNNFFIKPGWKVRVWKNFSCMSSRWMF